MTDHSRFGLWTLVGAIAFLVGLAMAFLTVWHLWSGWFQRPT
jgi:multisubunit Na+/H+ antiporter MnhB subunit